MSLFGEFRQFVMRGNVIDLAVGVVIGAAFGKIVTSFVNDILMPPIGLLTGGVDFSSHKVVLQPAVIDPITKAVLTPANELRWGLFINNVIDFLIVAAAIFLVIKAINTLYRKKEVPDAPPAPGKEEVLLTQIRDILQARA